MNDLADRVPSATPARWPAVTRAAPEVPRSASTREAIIIAVLLALVIRAVRGAGLHDPLRLHDGHPADRRLHPGQQVPLRRRDPLHRRAPARPARPARTATSSSSSTPTTRRATSSSASSRWAATPSRCSDNRVLRERHAPSTSPTCARAPFPPAPVGPLRLPLRLRSARGARRAPTSSWATTGTTRRTAATGASSSARRSAARPS